MDGVDFGRLVGRFVGLGVVCAFPDHPRFFPGGWEELANLFFPVFGRVDSSNGSVFLGVDGAKGAMVPNAATLALFVGASLIFVT